MDKVINKYTLSKKAKKDLEEIFDYTVETYNLKKAFTYITEIKITISNLLFIPSLGKERLEIKKGLFSISKNEHIIFYRILKNKIRIVRILHGSSDLPKYFK